jgi:hypothetical protein
MTRVGNPRNDGRLYNSHRREISRVLRVIAATVPLASGIACSDTFRAAGSPAAAATAVVHADQMFDAFATRFSPNVFDARYALARLKIGQSALVPSRIFDDTTVWDAHPNGSSRQLFVAGTMGADGRYRLDTRPSLTPMTRAGETRHAVMLEQTSPNQYRWDTRVDLAIGAMTPDEVAMAFNTLMRGAEGRTEKEVRDDYRAAFARTSAAFGHGFALDSVSLTPSTTGTTVFLRFGFHPETMKSAYPMLASYLDKYLGPAKSRVLLTDRAGAPLLEEMGRDHWMTVRYRVHEGRLVSLTGVPRPWPDTLTLNADVSLKVKLFTVGFHDMVTEFVNSNTSSGNTRERAWTIVAQREPKWDLPLLTERLIRSPLHHPFEGQGAMFRMAVHDSAGMSVFERRSRFDVQESAIMRFLGSLGAHALGDLDDRVENEEHRYLRDGFLALQADLKALR